jgi:uncharacterized alpha-E superfamily protein
MLSRTADHLYWMSRYTERAENTARMLNVSYDTSMLPQASQAARKAWQGVLSISELIPSYTRRHGEIQREAVLHFMVRDENNPSSIATCLRAARENARAVRGALTTEAWETQNQTWLELKRLLAEGDWERDPGQFFEWVKHRSHLSRGVTLGTMLQDEAFHFLRLGTFIERADNTARLLDVKFHAIERDYHGSARNGAAGKASAPFDFYHWSALLRSVSAFEVYRKVYRDVITPERVAELPAGRPALCAHRRNPGHGPACLSHAVPGPRARPGPGHQPRFPGAGLSAVPQNKAAPGGFVHGAGCFRPARRPAPAARPCRRQWARCRSCRRGRPGRRR